MFFLACVLPGAYMLAVSFLSPDGMLTLANYANLLADSRQRELLVTTITLGAAASAIATVIGVPLGFILARADLRRVTAVRLGLLAPLVIPPYVLALVWIFLSGYSDISYSLPGAALVLGIGFYPLSMLAAEAGFRRVDASLEEAGLMTTGPANVFMRITLPLVAPLVVAAGLLVFALAVAEFGVPGLLRVRVFTTEVFTAFAALYDFGRATALAVPLLVVTFVVAVLARWSAGERIFTPGRSSRRLLSMSNAILRAFPILVVFAAGLPIVVLAQHARLGVSTIVQSWPAIRLSILLSIVAATITVSIGVLLGYGRARMSRGGMAVDLLLLGAFALPSTVVGVGIIGVWNRPAIPLDVYASSLTIVLGYIGRFLPAAVLISAASVRQLPRSSEEAAEICGVGWIRGFLKIVVPQIRGGIVAAWVTVFVFAFGELGTTVLVTPPGESTLPVRVYTLIANAPQSDIAALALLQTLATVIPLCVFALTFGRMESTP
jgi:iron(III) transport system permease protein